MGLVGELWGRSGGVPLQLSTGQVLLEIVLWPSENTA